MPSTVTIVEENALVTVTSQPATTLNITSTPAPTLTVTAPGPQGATGPSGGGGSSSDASSTVKGISFLSTNPVVSTTPIAVGDNDTRVPSQAENDALVGTNGTPSSSNKYVTDSDARNTNARTPTAHASTHASGGGDAITIAESQVTNLVTDLAAKAPLASPVFTGNPTAPTPTAGDNDTSLATTAFVATSFAPLASPVFTGNPTGPTPSVDDNDTSLATTAYVIGQASAAGDGTPAAPGTAARGTSIHWARADHVHPTDTTRAPLASPVFTGDPQAPTPATADNDTSIATTAFVKAQGYLTSVSKTFRVSHTFAIQGTVTVITLPSFFVAKAASQTSNIVKARYKITGGTNVTFKIQKNGADWTGYGTSASPLTATTTAATTSQTNALADDDEISLVLVAVSGSPANLTVTLSFEHTV